MTIPSEGRFTSSSAEETVALGARLGSLLEGGENVLFVGELGAGKTTFIRGLAQGLGAENSGAVHSPSYTLVNTYPGAIPLIHIDAYFMHTAEDLLLCGYEEAVAAGGVIAIEWADKLEQFDGIEKFLPSEPIKVVLTLCDPGDEECRKIIIENWPEKGGIERA